jgi:hypothetical protein
MPTRPLDRLLFAQGGQCFFCKIQLPIADASVEHLVASVNGGTNGDDNCVVCCKAMNALLGRMSLKEKIQVVLNQKGQFKCPNDPRKIPATSSRKDVPPKAPSRVELVIANLQQRGSTKPKTVKTLLGTIRALFPKAVTDQELASLLQELKANGFLTIEGTKVVYSS